MTNSDTFARLIQFLRDLQTGKIAYSLKQSRDESVMVEVNVPGERWEVEFMEDGSIEVEKFRSDGKICGADALTELLEKYSD
jgi:hypothetical protein